MFKRARLKLCVTFRKKPLFRGEEFLARRPNSMLEDHPLSSVRCSIHLQVSCIYFRFVRSLKRCSNHIICMKNQLYDAGSSLKMFSYLDGKELSCFVVKPDVSPQFSQNSGNSLQFKTTYPIFLKFVLMLSYHSRLDLLNGIFILFPTEILYAFLISQCVLYDLHTSYLLIQSP
jgi:hypothetical protein